MGGLLGYGRGERRKEPPWAKGCRITAKSQHAKRGEREKKGGKKGRKEKGGAKESAGEDAPRRVERKPAITITLRVGVRPTQIRAVPPLLPPLNSTPRHAFLLSYTSKMTRRGVMKPRVASSLFLSLSLCRSTCDWFCIFFFSVPLIVFAQKDLHENGAKPESGAVSSL